MSINTLVNNPQIIDELKLIFGGSTSVVSATLPLVVASNDVSMPISGVWSATNKVIKSSSTTVLEWGKNGTAQLVYFSPMSYPVPLAASTITIASFIIPLELEPDVGNITSIIKIWFCCASSATATPYVTVNFFYNGGFLGYNNLPISLLASTQNCAILQLPGYIGGTGTYTVTLGVNAPGIITMLPYDGVAIEVITYVS